MHPRARVAAVALTIGAAAGATAVVVVPGRDAPRSTAEASVATTTRSTPSPAGPVGGRAVPPTAGAGPRPRAAGASAVGTPVPTPRRRFVEPPALRPAGALVPVRPTVVRRVRSARAEPTNPGAIRLRVVGPVTVAATVPDPGGGPTWAVRVFDAERTHTADGPTKVIGRNRCAQLGRVHRGRFGWLDGSGTFRPTRPSLHTSQTTCGSRRRDLNGRPEAQVLRTVTGLATDRPHLAATVLWGRLGPAARDVDVRFAGRRDATVAGTDRVVLRVGSPALDPRTVSVSTRYGGGFRIEAADPGGPASSLAVRTGDPSGGLPLGLTAARTDGRWCIGPVGRIIDGRTGTPNYRLGTFTEHTGRRFRCAGRAEGRAIPVQSSGGGDLGGEPSYAEGAPAPGRVARRTSRTLTWVAGQARDDVEALTFRTPSDLRTLTPAGPARAFLVVYDGTFQSGATSLVATLANGRQERSPLFLGPR